MYSFLRLQNFRSYQDYVVELDDGVNIVVGPNASGKTNLLEALYMVSLGRSWRGKNKDTVADGSDWARIDGHDHSGQRVLKVQPPRQPSLSIDNKAVKRQQRWAKQVPVVLFDPEDLRLLRGAPQRRREYLDKTLSQADQRYNQHLTRYTRALAQRNKLLKSEDYSTDEMFVWDLKLAEHGAPLISRRCDFVQSLNKKISDIYSDVAGKKHRLQVNYENELKNAGDIVNSLLKKLHELNSRDARLGYTSMGPHRDDLTFSINDVDGQSHASRGETRSLVLTLKIIEAELAEQAHDRKPVMLMDDVFSELDAARRRFLTEKLTGHQVVITTTDADAVIDHFSSGAYKIIPTES